MREKRNCLWITMHIYSQKSQRRCSFFLMMKNPNSVLCWFWHPRRTKKETVCLGKLGDGAVVFSALAAGWCESQPRTHHLLSQEQHSFLTVTSIAWIRPFFWSIFWWWRIHYQCLCLHCPWLWWDRKKHYALTGFNLHKYIERDCAALWLQNQNNGLKYSCWSQ